jgi:drug/metabolite transporter (DMT)-like permease
VALGFAGIVILVGPGALAGLAPGSAESAAALALLAALAGAVGYGVGSVLTRKAPPVEASTGAFMFCLLGAIAVTPMALMEGAPDWPGWAVVGSVLFLGVGPTGLASAGWVWLVHRRGALFGSMPTYLSPVWATLLGVAVLASAGVAGLRGAGADPGGGGGGEPDA